MRVAGMGAVVPEWMMVWLLIAAVAAFILGARRVAFLVAAVPLIHWLVWPTAAAAFFDLPFWLQLIFWATMPLLVLHAIITAIFGAETAGQFTGVMLVRIFDLVMLAPIWIVKFVGRLFVRK